MRGRQGAAEAAQTTGQCTSTNGRTRWQTRAEAAVGDRGPMPYAGQQTPRARPANARAPSADSERRLQCGVGHNEWRRNGAATQRTRHEHCTRPAARVPLPQRRRRRV
eukprot:6900895-Alexandrium_andersonii.AAC.1